MDAKDLVRTFSATPGYNEDFLAEAGLVETSSARTRFSEIEPGISVRESMNQRSQDFFRWDERTPRAKNEKIRACDQAYRTCGPVKFILDMMTDFVCQGLDIYHPNASKQDRYRHWWKRIDGNRISDLIVSHMFRHGGVGVLRAFSKLTTADIKDLDTTQAADDLPYIPSPAPTLNRIPIQYTVLNPTSLTPLGGALGMFAGLKRYGITLETSLANSIKNPRTKIDKDIVKGLPAYIVEAAKSADKIIPLDPEKIEVLYYKKDDYQYWPDPLVFSVLKDIRLYDKMKDADNAALESAISRVRLWILGSLEHKITVGKDQFSKLRNQILASRSGGAIDMIWDGALDFKESSSDFTKVLGQAKYQPSLQAINAGLGIPQSLTGGGDSGGMTNNALSLKTLIERLQYARNLLIRFWEGEFEKLRVAFGDRHAPRLRFDVMSLSDEAAEKMLWIQLYDRHLLSDETIQERFGELPEIETARMRKEAAQRTDDKRNPRQGPFTEQAGHPDQLKKAVLGQGIAAPSQVGVKLQPKAEGEKSLLDRQEAQTLKTAKIAAQNKPAAPGVAPTKKKGTPGQGRPKGKKDDGKRKTRTPKVQATASIFTLQMKARNDLKAIGEVITPAYLAQLGKKNLRGLSNAESETLEHLKFAHLMDTAVGEQPHLPAIAADLTKTPLLQHLEVLNDLTADSFVGRGVNPTVEDTREMMVSVYVMTNLETDDGDLESDD